MKVVVTGAAGFLGSHLVDRFVADGNVVLGLDDLSSGALGNLAAARRRKGFTFHHFDVTSPLVGDLLARERPDVVVHVAPVLPVQLLTTEPPRVLLASSASVYGSVRTPVTERHGTHPASIEVARHVAAEAYLQGSGVPGAALRLTSVYGPRSSGVVTTWMKALQRGRPTYVRGSVVRDWVHVDDVVDAFVRCLGGKADGRRLNIGTGVGTTTRDLHTAVAAAVGAPDAPEFGAGEKTLASVLVDPGAARRALGWEATIPLKTGLARTLDSLRGA